MRETESVLKVNSGQTAVIGGLMQDQIIRTSDGVPVLQDIKPGGIGNLFKFNNAEYVKSELVIFLRPTVIRTADVYDGDMRSFLPYLPANLAPIQQPLKSPMTLDIEKASQRQIGKRVNEPLDGCPEEGGKGTRGREARQGQASGRGRAEPGVHTGSGPRRPPAAKTPPPQAPDFTLEARDEERTSTERALAEQPPVLHEEQSVPQGLEGIPLDEPRADGIDGGDGRHHALHEGRQGIGGPLF